MGVQWQTLILGIVQGITEFLPISSSGHLALLQMFFGFSGNNMLAFDLLLHCATVGAVLLFFGRDIVSLLRQWFLGFASRDARASEGWKTGWAILLGTLVTAVVGLPMKDAVEAAMDSRLAVGIGLLATSGVLCMVPLIPEKQRSVSIRVALVVGIAQGLAVFPGISRSGSTIMAALCMGLAASDAFRFSFLMAVPAILGASLLEFLDVLRGSAAFALPEGWLPGVLAAFVLGLLSLKILRRLVLSGKWAYFAIYCFLLGLVAVLSDVVTSF